MKFNLELIKIYSKNNFKNLILPISFFVLGLILEFGVNYFYKNNNENIDNFYKIHQLNRNFKYINPLLGFDFSEKKTPQKYLSLETKIKDSITDAIANKKASNISVYFRNLENGTWVGVDETKEYAPASLLKVPTMIAYYKWAETNPSILSKKIIYQNLSLTGQPHDDFNRNPNLKIGKEYTTEDLIRSMIVYSDNVAKDLLINNISLSYLYEIYSDFGIPFPQDNFNISPKAYSLFFRTLYNSTYLTNKFSEMALSILSETTFDKGLAMGVPKNIKISHKFGEDETEQINSNNTQLHDCGLIYYPTDKNPYFLCVMTQGYNLNDLADVIKNISAIVYNDVKIINNL